VLKRSAAACKHQEKIVTETSVAAAAEARQREENKRIVLDFYQRGLLGKDFEAARQHLGPRYIQHNPLVADGPEGLRAFLQFLREEMPDLKSQIKRVFVDGDYVILHVHALPESGARGVAVVDIFKLENGKIVEHWDVMQEIPEQSANANGMF
jgi:predicted SnoaL-like aldol condensation-catalyzing enzyme